MEKKWDYLDEIIKDAYKEIEPGTDYNVKLIERIHRKSFYEGKAKTMAASFILAGVLCMFLYASNAEFNLLSYKYKIESQIFALQYNYHLSFNKFFLGEWTK